MVCSQSCSSKLMSPVRADVTGRADGLVSYGSSGIVDRHGTVLQVATQLEVGLVVAEVDAPTPRSQTAESV